MTNVWTDDRIQTMRDLFEAKHSASEIAASLGGVSRNAVCGKLARLGLVRGWGPTHPDKVIKVKRARSPKNPPLLPGAPKFNAELFVCAEAKDVVTLDLSFDNLTEFACRYPSLTAPFTFCGHPKQDGSSYCSPHHRLCAAGIPARKNVQPTAFGQSKGGVFGRTA